MQRLKSTSKQIPGGFFFRQSAIGWDSKKVLGLHPSFSTLVAAVISARKANPHHTAKNKWSTDPAVVAQEVEAFQVRVCASMGWKNYIADAGASAIPFSSSPALDPKHLAVAAAAIKRIWTGVKTLNDFLDSGEPAVSNELAESRASVCVNCQANGKGDWSRWFVKPAAMAIARQIEKLENRKLSTSKDTQIQICEICVCPLRVKVFTPMKFIKPHMPDGMLNELRTANEHCWIVKEVESSGAVG